jgi:hypothetical protein
MPQDGFRSSHPARSSSCSSRGATATPRLPHRQYRRRASPGRSSRKDSTSSRSRSRTPRPTDLSVTVHSLTTIAGGTPITGVTIGIGFGTVSGTTCAMQIFTPAAPLGQELFAPNGASAGSYCVQIFDCPPGTENCESVLTEPVTYSMSVRHF